MDFLEPSHVSLKPVCGFSTTFFFLVYPAFSFCRENAFHHRSFCDLHWSQATGMDTGFVFSLGLPMVPWSEIGCTGEAPRGRDQRSRLTKWLQCLGPHGGCGFPSAVFLHLLSEALPLVLGVTCLWGFLLTATS